MKSIRGITSTKSITGLVVSLFFYLLAIPYTLHPSLAQDLGPPPAGVQQLQNMIQRIINLSVGIAFVVLIIMLLVGGIKFITSGGEKKSIESASQTMTWALLGILFLALAWVLLILIEKFTGVPVTRFCIGLPGSDQCKLN